MRSKFFEKLIDRLDVIDPDSLQNHFLHLAGEKGLLETIFHAMQEGLIVLDRSACILYANKAAEQMIGFTMSDAEGEPLQRYIRDLDWDEVTRFDERTDWSRLVSRDLEITYPEHRFVEFYIVPLSQDAAVTPPNGAVVIFRDVTSSRETQQSTLESERLKAITLLAAGVAHEIGNPLNSLHIHLQLLERDLKDDEDIDPKDLLELVDISRKEVTRLDTILTQFLKAIRPQALDLQANNLSVLLQESVQFLQAEIADRGVLIEVDEPDEVPPVNADSVQVKQVFYNIIRNAVQAMGEGGLLKISLVPGDRFLALSFQDSGPGIDQDQLSQIFQPYHTTKTEGSGLGLMIVQRIMRDHGGQIEVESRPGEGTTFTLFFPREDRRIRLLRAPESSENETP